MGANVRKDIKDTFLGFQTRSFQTQPAQLERLTRALKFNGSTCRYNSFQGTNNRGADQNVWMYRLVCVFVVCMQQHQVFSQRGVITLKTQNKAQ